MTEKKETPQARFDRLNSKVYRLKVMTRHIPHVLTVEVHPVGVADQDGGQQPGEQQAVLQNRAGLLLPVLKNVIAGRHDDDAGQRGGASPWRSRR